MFLVIDRNWWVFLHQDPRPAYQGVVIEDVSYDEPSDLLRSESRFLGQSQMDPTIYRGFNSMTDLQQAMFDRVPAAYWTTQLTWDNYLHYRP